MKKLGFTLLLLIIGLPIAKACFFPQDLYAVEVEIEGTYNLEPLLSAKNVLLEDGKIVYRSHYDPRLIVMVWKDTTLHVRVQIPTSFGKRTIYTETFEGIIPIDDVFERAKERGWKVSGNSIKKENIAIFITPKVGNECKADSDCKAQGCSGEACTPKNETVFSICIYREWYKCLNLTSCGCYHGTCSWKPTEDFIRCLKKYNATLEDIIRARAIVTIEVYDELGDEIIKEINDTLGCNIPTNFKKSESQGIIPDINPEDLNANLAIETELKWLRKIGVIDISEEDIKEISRIAKWGYAGHNSRIGFYDGEWKPYFNYSNAELVRCVGSGFKDYKEELPMETPEVGKTCGPAILALLSLLALGGRKYEDSNDVLGGDSATSDKGKGGKNP
ncbi:CGP-CTERM-anchored Cys-rich protein [Pyrococcus abyssi]|uniref:Uncharacterized protein n=1 Tax=Pyrococcus abyssi (strain GE5 / Orsay) TaxID=272844 RepID=Q9UZ26_PYRAB|nr:CGP-CTERM-anchored Cys-rich protein [Pyrococcus abyssi]CAB50236.1 Hypothetical protein PAB0876 [Pyrococcus abyssi GE5]CCE70773.1 TPA: hypothetical protein PAB0876 [Pyrococcus abyssi GE5]